MGRDRRPLWCLFEMARWVRVDAAPFETGGLSQCGLSGDVDPSEPGSHGWGRLN